MTAGTLSRVAPSMAGRKSAGPPTRGRNYRSSVSQMVRLLDDRRLAVLACSTSEEREEPRYFPACLEVARSARIVLVCIRGVLPLLSRLRKTRLDGRGVDV